MNVRSWPAQQSGLTRAVNKERRARQAMTKTWGQSPDTEVKAWSRARKAVMEEVIRAVREWNSGQAPYDQGWPDDWHRWDAAAYDAGFRGDIRDL